MHSSAPADISELVAILADEVTVIWTATQKVAVLTAVAPRFEFQRPGP
jgi:hypothetical protein